MKVLERYAHEETYHSPEDKLRKLYRDMVSVWYGFNNYGCSVKHILELCDAIKSEYPDIKEADMEAWQIKPSLSTRHAHHTLLRISIPVEDFIKLRQERKISIL